MYLIDGLKEVEPGIYTRKGCKSDAPEIEEHYREKALKILQDDRYHYTCMRRVFSDLFDTEFYSVADIGGGHPKLASCMNVSEITVYDQFAEFYESLHDEFLKLYRTKASVKYEEKKITHPNFTPNAEVAICCHVLEHLELKKIRKLLSNLETRKVLIYGPNIETAKSAGWFHYPPKDHITFCTVAAMAGLVEEAGFKVEVAQSYHQDMLIFASK